jgi:hypothetical protein
MGDRNVNRWTVSLVLLLIVIIIIAIIRFLLEKYYDQIVTSLGIISDYSPQFRTWSLIGMQ